VRQKAIFQHRAARSPSVDFFRLTESSVKTGVIVRFLIGTSRPRRRWIYESPNRRTSMITKSIIVASALIFATSAFAQGVSNKTPGHQMQDATKSTAPGASEYAPGHKMQNATKSTAPGASEYAPGHQTIGSNTKKR
jgi:hypothetical protein